MQNTRHALHTARTNQAVESMRVKHIKMKTDRYIETG